MKRLATILIALLTLCTACHKKQVVADKPDNLINRKKMVEILTDSYLAEAYIYASMDSVSIEDLTLKLYKDIFDRHQITKDQFIQSMEYYISDKELLQKMLEEVTNNITQLKTNSNIPDSLIYRPLESILHPNNLPKDTAGTDSVKNSAPGLDI
ncbi:MAG: DUF4296 domain-containing protein [Bacteroidales bacterium]|nr:DUF4296 domain-containing protein [Bacteroidales bacterium]